MARKTENTPKTRAPKAAAKKDAPPAGAAERHSSVEPSTAAVSHSPNIPGTIQYTDLRGDVHTAYVARRHAAGGFDLTYHVGNEKRHVNHVAQGTGPGTWQELPAE